MQLKKIRLREICTPVWLQAMTPSNIISGFPATGIYPFTPEAKDCEIYHSNGTNGYRMSEKTGNYARNQSTHLKEEAGFKQ